MLGTVNKSLAITLVLGLSILWALSTKPAVEQYLDMHEKSLAIDGLFCILVDRQDKYGWDNYDSSTHHIKILHDAALDFGESPKEYVVNYIEVVSNQKQKSMLNTMPLWGKFTLSLYAKLAGLILSYQSLATISVFFGR